MRLLASDTLTVVDQLVANSADEYFHAFVPVHRTILNSAMEYRGRIIADAAEIVAVVGIVPVDFYFDERGFHFETTHQKETREVTSACL